MKRSFLLVLFALAVAIGLPSSVEAGLCGTFCRAPIQLQDGSASNYFILNTGRFSCADRDMCRFPAPACPEGQQLANVADVTTFCQSTVRAGNAELQASSPWCANVLGDRFHQTNNSLNHCFLQERASPMQPVVAPTNHTSAPSQPTGTPATTPTTPAPASGAGTCVRICYEAPHTDRASGRVSHSLTLVTGTTSCTQAESTFCNTISGTPTCPRVEGRATTAGASIAAARRFCEGSTEFYQAPGGPPSWCADLLAGRFLERQEGNGSTNVIEQKCRLPSTVTPTPAAGSGSGAGGAAAVRLSPSIPQLSVPIPGVTITAPTQNDDGTISVPYLAQYISGVYGYLLGISTIVAIIMVVYGGFLYLLASTGIQVASGKTIIQDALIGLVVLYGSYFILWNVNPDLVNLRPIVLRTIQSVALLEAAGEGAAADVTGDGAPGNSTSCSMHFNQFTGRWASLAYGNNASLIVGGTQTFPTCANSTEANDSTQCQSTFAQSACGVTSMASLLGFYNLEIAIPSRVPAPGAAMHPIDPIDTGIYSILNGGRDRKNGPGGSVFWNSFNQYFPQFQQQSVSNAVAIQKAREGKPVVIACDNINLYADEAATQPVAGRTGNTNLYPHGHFMVLKGVVNDQILRVHDVGNPRSRTMRVADFNAHCSGRLITPKANAPREVTATWGTGAQAVQVRMRLPEGGATNQCHMTGGTTASAGGGSPCAAGSGLSCYSFTYKANNNMVSGHPTIPIWPENSARLLYPTRLQGQRNVPVHAFIFLHGDNSHNTPIEQARYMRNYLPPALSEHVDKNIVIMTPHHNGTDQSTLNLADFYATAQRALQAALPGARIVDVAVGGSSGATCGTATLRQATTAGIQGLKAIIGYDGCLGDASGGINPRNLIPTSGVSLYLNPDTIGSGMGLDRASGSGGLNRLQLIQREWRISSVTCPPCAQGLAHACFGPSTQRSTGELFSFETKSNHGPNVTTMSKIAFCALYQPAASSQ